MRMPRTTYTYKWWKEADTSEIQYELRKLDWERHTPQADIPDLTIRMSIMARILKERKVSINP